MYDGQNHAWLPSTEITEGDDWTVSGNVYEWAVPRKCIAYFRMAGTSNGAFVRLGVNMHPDADPDNAYTVFNIPSLTSTALVPVFLNAGDTVYFKVANNNLGSMSLSVFYTD